MVNNFNTQKINKYITKIFNIFKYKICKNINLKLVIDWANQELSFYGINQVQCIFIYPYNFILNIDDENNLYTQIAFTIIHEITHTIIFTDSYMYENSELYYDYIENQVNRMAGEYFNKYYNNINILAKSIINEKIELYYIDTDVFKEYEIQKQTLQSHIVSILMSIHEKSTKENTNLIYNMLYNKFGEIAIKIINGDKIDIYYILSSGKIDISFLGDIIYNMEIKYKNYNTIINVKTTIRENGFISIIYYIKIEKYNIDMIKLISKGENKND